MTTRKHPPTIPTVPPWRPLTREERRRLVETPIVITVIGGSTHGGVSKGDMIPIEGRRTSPSYSEDEELIAVRKNDEYE